MRILVGNGLPVEFGRLSCNSKFEIRNVRVMYKNVSRL